jgi:pyruvate dehydrogenase E1 component
VPYLTSALADAPGPVVAVSDYMRQVPDQIAQWVPGDYTSLGTDGFGFSDTRQAARRFFAVDGPSIVTRLLGRLAAAGQVDAELPARAIETYRLHDVTAGTTGTAGGDA